MLPGKEVLGKNEFIYDGKKPEILAVFHDLFIILPVFFLSNSAPVRSNGFLSDTSHAYIVSVLFLLWRGKKACHMHESLDEYLIKTQLFHTAKAKLVR